ncbi:MAG: IS256 family transposase [Acidobacteria bacterium]|nr:IS256 family transposase [Acidobacteriota bacterium]MBI3427548.1 IS256 family transposase [Acidobacteriota bacterium]
MSAKTDTQTTTPAFAPELLQQLLAERKTAGEIEDLLKDLRKAFIEHALQGELTHLLGYEKHAVAGRKSGNSRNGTSRKTLKTEDSTVELAIPRDRHGAFAPQLLGKYERRWEGFDELILALYARGMSTRDIQDLLRQKYAVEISPQFVSDVCSAVSTGVAEWRERPLAAVWPIVYLDALHLKVRDEGRVVGKALYVAVGVNLEGRKELLGLWLAQGEGAKFWLQVLTELQARGLQDILSLCCDGLQGLPEAVASVFPHTTVQTCVVHLVRYSLRMTSDQDGQQVTADLKTIYQAATESAALRALEAFQIKWDKKYPLFAKSWRANWARIRPMFELPAEIRRAVYTTNVIESLNFSLRKILKGRSAFPNDASVYRLIYLSLEQVSRKWTMPIKHWKAALQQLAILFEERLPLAGLAPAQP